MKRLLPQSLVGQMALLIGAALLIAQLVNFGLILNERQKLSLARNEGPAITRFASTLADYAQAPREFRGLVLKDASRRGARFTLDPLPRVSRDADRRSETEERLMADIAAADVAVGEVRAAIEWIGRPGGGARRWHKVEALFLSVRLEDGYWLNARIFLPPRDPLLTARLLLATVVLYLIVLGVTLFIARRLSRPLQDLTRAAETFGGRTAPAAVEPRGPHDLRQAIEAFNAMNRRVLALLDEKDRMLGAIGHDLRTPLASIRIRLEAMEPEDERARVAASIEEMTAMLEDILVLARSGRSREQARDMDVTALVDALCEDYAELGHKVEFLPSERLILPVQPNLLRRALRNLVDNALKYAGSARLQLGRENGLAVISVLDSGPGLPPDQLERVLEPFYRVEASRNRETGGSGLGLAIAKAIAESHGGTLEIANRPEGGLAAIVRLPLSAG